MNIARFLGHFGRSCVEVILLCCISSVAVWAVQAQLSEAPTSSDQIRLTFAPVVKQSAPAVVNIYTRRIVQQRAPNMFNDPFFRRFFGGNLDGLFDFPRERVQNSLGSGVIIGNDGIVITNDHVISNSDEITVVLSDRREFEATVVGTDKRTDLAVLRIETNGDKLPTLELGDSDILEVGDLVLAIGNPFGVGQTVTSGIVSALARTTIGVTDFRSFIQTDAAINPGNSGGALVTVDGRLVGINTAIYSRDGGNVGIGFAIPSNMVSAVLNGLLSDGKAIRPWLGAGGQAVTPELARALGMDRPTGVLVNRIASGSPADAAGIEVGDVLREVNGREITDTQVLRYQLATLPVGTTTRFAITRDGVDKVVNVELVAPPDLPPRHESQLSGSQPFSGATVANLNPALSEEISRDMVEDRVIVLRVQNRSIAARVGIRPGDLVLRVNNTDIKNVSLLKQVTASPKRNWRLSLQRGERVVQLSVRG